MSTKRRARPSLPRQPMPRKPPKVETPPTVYRRRVKHPKRSRPQESSELDA